MPGKRRHTGAAGPDGVRAARGVRVRGGVAVAGGAGVVRPIVIAAGIGVLAGAAATTWILEPDVRLRRDEPIAGTRMSSASDVRTSAPSSAAIAPLDAEQETSERAVLLERISRADRSALRTMLADAVDIEPSSSREFMLGALVARIADDDPETALTWLQELNLDPRSARQLGLIVLNVLEPGADSLERIQQALPQIDEERFVRQALVELAIASPERAIDIAIAIDDRQRREDAVRAVAEAWAEKDGSAALAHAQVIEDSNLKQAFETAALREFGSEDLDVALAYVESQYAGDPIQHDRLMRQLTSDAIGDDPERALELARRLNGAAAYAYTRQISDRVAREDPLAAYALAERLPPGRERQELRLAAARAYGERDAAAAIAWARARDGASHELIGGVLESIARTDLLRAIEIAEQYSLGPYIGKSPVLSAAFYRPGSTGADMAQVAERVLAIRDESVRQQWLASLTMTWSFQDPDAALDWLVANSARARDGERGLVSMFSDVARELGEQDPTAALARTAQLPPNAQEPWVEMVTRAVAFRDPAGAAEWIAGYRGQSVYEAGAAIVVQALARSDPDRASSLFATLGPDRQRDGAKALGQIWAAQDQAAAIDWAATLALGETRDGALLGIFASLDTAPDPGVLALFDAAAVREQAMLGFIARIAGRDPLEARRLSDLYLSDPALRERALRLLPAVDPRGAGR